MTREERELARLRRWRLESLLQLGLERFDAEALVELPDVRARAAALLAAGCPPATVARLLRADVLDLLGVPPPPSADPPPNPIDAAEPELAGQSRR